MRPKWKPSRKKLKLRLLNFVHREGREEREDFFKVILLNSSRPSCSSRLITNNLKGGCDVYDNEIRWSWEIGDAATSFTSSMKAPIPSPVAEAIRIRPFTGRVEWDEESQCLLLVGRPNKLGIVLYATMFTSIRQPSMLICLVLCFPFTFLVLLIAACISAVPTRYPGQMRVYAQGFTLTQKYESALFVWADCRKFYETERGIYILRRWMQQSFYQPREDFADDAEYHRFSQALQSLIDTNGASWTEVTKQYKYQ